MKAAAVGVALFAAVAIAVAGVAACNPTGAPCADCAQEEGVEIDIDIDGHKIRKTPTAVKPVAPAKPATPVKPGTPAKAPRVGK